MKKTDFVSMCSLQVLVLFIIAWTSEILSQSRYLQPLSFFMWKLPNYFSVVSGCLVYSALTWCIECRVSLTWTRRVCLLSTPRKFATSHHPQGGGRRCKNLTKSFLWNSLNSFIFMRKVLSGFACHVMYITRCLSTMGYIYVYLSLISFQVTYVRLQKSLST